MKLNYRYFAVAFLTGVALGLVSFSRDHGTSKQNSTELSEVEVDEVKLDWDAAGFKNFWRNVHGPSLTSNKLVEKGSEAEGFSSNGSWRLLGVVAIAAQRIAYISNAENQLFVVKEGEEFGEKNLVTQIKNKSVTYKNFESENQVLSLYQVYSEVKL